MKMKWVILALEISIVLVINYWVWFKPTSFVKFIKTAKKARFEQLPSQEIKWRFIENPYYIWFPRIIFTIVLFVFIFMLYMMFH